MSQKSEANDKKKLSYWLKFLIDAGITPDRAVTYTVNFVENHIEENMLGDLTKEYLKEMGIKALGDIIAILKHSEMKLKRPTTNLTNLSAAAADIQASASTETDSINSVTPPPEDKPRKSRFKTTPVTASSKPLKRESSPVEIRCETNSPITMRVKADSVVRSRQRRDEYGPVNIQSKTTSPITMRVKADSPIRSRRKQESPVRQTSPIVIHRTVKPSKRESFERRSPITIHTKSHSAAKREKILPPEDSDSRTQSQREEVPLQKKRRVLPEHEGRYKIIMPAGTSQKTAKLLSEGKISSTTTPVHTPSRSAKSSRIFSRLGSSRPHIDSDEELEEDNSAQAGDNSNIRDDVEFTIKLGDYRMRDEESSDIDEHHGGSGDSSPVRYEVNQSPDAAPYIGVLKNSERKSKKSLSPHVSELKNRLGKSSHTPTRNIKYRLGDNTVSSTTDIKPSTSRLSEKYSPFSVSARLGAKPSTSSRNQSTSVRGIKAEVETSSVFKRLGK